MFICAHSKQPVGNQSWGVGGLGCYQTQRSTLIVYPASQNCSSSIAGLETSQLILLSFELGQYGILFQLGQCARSRELENSWPEYSTLDALLIKVALNFSLASAKLAGISKKVWHDMQFH